MNEEAMKLQNNGVVFTEQDHTYTLHDKQLSGITGMIREKLFPHKFDGISEEKLQAAAERGTAVHKLIELGDTTMAGNIRHENKQYERAAMYYINLRTNRGMYAIANEYCVTDEYVYATNIDCVWAANPYGNEVILADIKTTYELDREYLSWQLSVCAYLFELQNPHLRVVGLTGIWLPFRQGVFAVEKAQLATIQRKDNELVKKLLYTDELNVTDQQPTNVPAIIADDYIAQLIDAAQQIKHYKAIYDTISEQLKAAMQFNGIRTWDAGKIRATYSAPTKRKSFDSKAFAADHPDLYNKYCKQTQSKDRVTITIRE